MRIVHLTPGTGSFHCGSCLRDHALIKALRAMGHDALMAPLYLPLVTDGDVTNPEQPVRVGGVGLYLQQKFPWFRFFPRFVHRWLDSTRLLRWASKRIGMTSARDLGEMTVGSLEGEQGRQWPEWQKLVEWIVDEAKPEVVSLSNSLLIGLAPALKKAGLPVVCSLQGEDGFLDTLVEPYRTRAWELMQVNAQSVTCFIAPSRFYANVMAEKLAAKPEQMAVVMNGLDFRAYRGEKREPQVPTIGFLARMIHGKGLTTLIEAFIELKKRNRVPGLRLRVGGASTPSDEPYLKMLRDKLAAAGVADSVTWEPNLTFGEKVAFLHSITVFSVPATCGEAFGLYMIEAQGCGVPVVQPRHGAFPELLDTTQGGVLVEPDDVGSLADGLESLVMDEVKRKLLAEAATRNTEAEFSAQRMAESFAQLLSRFGA